MFCRRLAVVGALTVFVLVTGCKEDKAPATETSGQMAAAPQPAQAAPAAPARDACKLVPAAELKMLAGVEAEGKSSKSGGAEVCTWMTAKGSVVLQVFPWASSYEQARKAFEEQFKAKVEEVPGLGDKGFYIAGKISVLEAATVVAQKGSTPVSVQVMEMGGAPASLREQAVGVAKAVVEKL